MDRQTQRLTRRELVEKLLAGMAAGVVWPMLASAHPMREHLTDAAMLDRAEAVHKAPDWKPLFLNVNQNESLAALSESILPGSDKAHVNRFIDLLLSVDTEEDQAKFVASLASMDSAAQKAFGRGFHLLAASERSQILTSVSTQEPHQEDFDNLREWITVAYYSSEEGMRELGWTGKHAFGSLPPCNPAS
jgi:hypothetical protein